MQSGFPKILGTATLNEKGQLVIPVEARNDLGLSPGTKVVIMSSSVRPALVIVKAEEIEALMTDISNALQAPPAKNE
jgi:AbrB family looped-hinge helix DNA binding protein